MEEKRTYEGMVEEWISTYKSCAQFEDQIRQGKIAEEEIEEYLQEKARLIVCLGNLFAIKSIEEKGTYEIDFINSLYADVKFDMEEKEVELSEFDSNYIFEMIKEMEKDFIEAEEKIQDVEFTEVEEEE